MVYYVTLSGQWMRGAVAGPGHVDVQRLHINRIKATVTSCKQARRRLTTATKVSTMWGCLVSSAQRLWYLYPTVTYYSIFETGVIDI